MSDNPEKKIESRPETGLTDSPASKPRRVTLTTLPENAPVASEGFKKQDSMETEQSAEHVESEKAEEVLKFVVVLPK